MMADLGGLGAFWRNLMSPVGVERVEVTDGMRTPLMWRPERCRSGSRGHGDDSLLLDNRPPDLVPFVDYQRFGQLAVWISEKPPSSQQE